MRLRVIVLCLMAVVGFTSSAQAAAPKHSTDPPCWCQAWFAQSYTTNVAHRARLDWSLDFHGVGPINRSRMASGIYDWQKGGYQNTPSFCKTYPLVCRAVKACIIAAGGIILVDAAKGAAQWDVIVDSSGACAVAAATVIAAG